MKKPTKESIRIAGYISEFLNNYVLSQKTDSINTLKSYRDTLALYLIYLEEEKKVQCGSLSADAFHHTVIEEWLAWLQKSRKNSPDSCNNRLAALRAFLKYLSGRDAAYLHLYLEASEIPRRKCLKKKVEGLTREAVKALMEAPDPSSKCGRRDLAFIILLYSTAARLDEILSMKNDQLHLSAEKAYVVIIGKGSKIRTLYLLPKVVAHLTRYLREFHGETPDPEAYVFYSRNTGSHGKMTQPAISKMLKKYAKAAHENCRDVPLDLHAHQFRHSKASHWLEDGMNIVQISFLLGHEQLQTTMIYLDITTEEKAKALATLEDENDKKVSAKLKNSDGSLVNFCGVRKKG